VIDSHTHVWGPDTDDHPWATEPMVETADELPVETVYSAEELLANMDEVGIDEAFIIGLPVTHWLDNWYVEKVAREYDRLYGIGLLDPFADDAATELHRLMEIEDFVGFRLATVFPRDGMYEVDPADTVETDWLIDAIDESEFWEACAETGTSVNLLCHYEQLNQVQKLVDTYPELTYVIDHFGRAGGDVPDDDDDFARFAELTENENVLVKASAIPYLSNEDFPHLDMENKIRWLLDEVGREQVAWGSDYPFVSPVSDYEGTLTCLDYMDSISSQDREWLTDRSFKRHLDL